MQNPTRQIKEGLIHPPADVTCKANFNLPPGNIYLPQALTIETLLTSLERSQLCLRDPLRSPVADAKCATLCHNATLFISWMCIFL